jgi:hypothetical protein
VEDTGAAADTCVERVAGIALAGVDRGVAGRMGDIAALSFIAIPSISSITGTDHSNAENSDAVDPDAEHSNPRHFSTPRTQPRTQPLIPA